MKKISKPVAVVVAVSACAIIGIGAVCAAKSTHEVASSEPTMVTEEVSTPEVATPEIAVEETDAVEADAGDESESQDVDASEEGEATESEEMAASEAADEELAESESVAVSEEAAEAEPEAQAEQEPDPEPAVEEEVVVEPEPQQESVDVASQMASRPGMMGRLSIPDVGIDVAVFNSDSQATADAVDSACYFDWLGYPVMGDHQNQGWSALQYCVPGSTLAYFDNGSSVTTYICTDNFTGINTGYGFTYDDGTPISGSSLVLYTCLGSDWTHDRFCYFIPA